MPARVQTYVTRLVAIPGAVLPVGRLVQGQTVCEAAILVPRIFNLCPAAQNMAIRVAGGQKPDDVGFQALVAEIAREHVLRLTVILPDRVGLPRLIERGGLVAQNQVLFGPLGFPQDVRDFEQFMASDVGVALLLRRIAQRFGPGIAVCDVLPEPTPDRMFNTGAIENSVAARHLRHPVLRHLEQTFGRGPLWRVVARAIDFAACVRGDIPDPMLVAPGRAVVPAARGLYALDMPVEHGRIARFSRMTPTDHMLAPGGVLGQSLARLPFEQHSDADLLLDILDPCSPVTLREERADA